MARPRIEMIGRRFGRLLVQELAGMERANDHRRWLCACDCGNPHTASGRDLRKGTTQSCGCLRREKSTEQGKRMAERRRLAREEAMA